MTDRYNALIVVLDREIREDDAQTIISAIEMIKGVLSVSGNVEDIDSFVEETKAKHKVLDKLYALIKELS